MGSPTFPPPTATPEQAQRDLAALLQEHARLRAELEERFERVQEIEERFLALRPRSAPGSTHEIRKNIILLKPWRDELDQAYQGLLATTHQLGLVLRRIHEIQLYLAAQARRA